MCSFEVCQFVMCVDCRHSKTGYVFPGKIKRNWRDIEREDIHIHIGYVQIKQNFSLCITNWHHGLSKTQLWQCAYLPLQDKATQTHTHTSRASLAWHAGPAHYYNAKLLVAKETWGRGRVPVAMAASLHPANCLPPWDLTIVDREREKERREKKWGQNEVRRERLEGVMVKMLKEGDL